MFTRPPSSPIMAKRKPAPSAPRRLATGTRAPSKITAVVGWLFQPSFLSFLPKERPGVSRGTRDRKSVVKGKSVSVRVDLGGCRTIKNKKKNKTTNEVVDIKIMT